MRRRLDLSGAIVLITGAGQGIGREIVLETLRRGGIAVAVEINPESARKIETEIGGQGTVHIADVCDAAAMAAVARDTIQRYGGIDVVIANAGIERVAPVQDMDPADFEAVIETNIMGVYRTIKPALDSVIARNGHVIAISSVAGLIPFPLAAAYSASKAAVDMMMRVIRMELSGTGASAGAAYFGFVQTRMADRIFSDPVIARAIARIPSRLLGIRPLPTPHQVAVIILNGAERRRARVFAPRMVGITFLLRGVYALFDTLISGKVMRLDKLIDELRAANRK